MIGRKKVLEDDNFTKILKRRQDAFDCDYLNAIDGNSIKRISGTILEIMNR